MGTSSFRCPSRLIRALIYLTHPTMMPRPRRRPVAGRLAGRMAGRRAAGVPAAWRVPAIAAPPLVRRSGSRRWSRGAATPVVERPGTRVAHRGPCAVPRSARWLAVASAGPRTLQSTRQSTQGWTAGCLTGRGDYRRQRTWAPDCGNRRVAAPTENPYRSAGMQPRRRYLPLAARWGPCTARGRQPGATLRLR